MDMEDAPAPPAPNAEDGTPEPPQAMSVKFGDAAGFELTFKLKGSTKLGRAMDAYSARVSKPRETLRFLFEGERVVDDTTPDKLNMEDGDKIEVYQEQIGGGKSGL